LATPPETSSNAAIVFFGWMRSVHCSRPGYKRCDGAGLPATDVDRQHNDLAYMARKLGGWTFQELNFPVEQLKQYTQNGPDIFL